MAYPNPYFFNHNCGSYLSFSQPPSPQNFENYIQSTPSNYPSQTFVWCHYCHNASHPAEECWNNPNLSNSSYELNNIIEENQKLLDKMIEENNNNNQQQLAHMSKMFEAIMSKLDEQEEESANENETLPQPICEPMRNPIFEKCQIHESPNIQFFDIFEDDDCKYLDEFEFEDNVEKEKEDLSVLEDGTLVQPLCEDEINPISEKYNSHESPNNQYFDIFKDEDCTYLDNLFEDNVEKKDESLFENEIPLQPICEHVINPISDKCIIHESSNDKFFDIFDDDDCTYVDNLFEENIEMHTNSLEDEDNNCDDACIEDKVVFDEKSYEDNSNNFCGKIIVEKHDLSPKHVEKIVKTPFERKTLDLNIFTFEDKPNDKKFNHNVNEKICGEIIEDEIKIFIEDEWKTVRIKSLSNDNSFVLDDGEDESNLKKRKKRRRRVRTVKNKMERGRAKMTKRLSSTKSPLRRTHWNDGKRARGRNRPSLI
jgi:hypothetical protein